MNAIMSSISNKQKSIHPVFTLRFIFHFSIAFTLSSLTSCHDNMVIEDIDGNRYQTVWIGNNLWMAENLQTTHYSNGNPIPNIVQNTQWSNLEIGAWSYYKNQKDSKKTYGKLYNWFTVSDHRNVCPKGWHVATDEEWFALGSFLGGNKVAGDKMKTTGSNYWVKSDSSVTNESRFSGLPSGLRFPSGEFGHHGYYGYWWSSSMSTSDLASGRYLYDNNSEIGIGSSLKSYGFCIRCVKNVQ